ncbi:MAG: LUD domain-containing protein [Conexibacter sp.]
MTEQFAQRAAEAGFTVHRGELPQLDGAAVSHAAYALADTGSVVLLSSDEPRAQSLLAFTHVTVVRTDTILPDLEALFEALGGELPSSVAIVTGPSRSADIEQRLAVGVHGPGDVHVVLQDAAPSAAE